MWGGGEDKNEISRYTCPIIPLCSREIPTTPGDSILTVVRSIPLSTFTTLVHSSSVHTSDALVSLAFEGDRR